MTPMKGVKAWGEGPLRPKEISRYQDTLSQIHAADNTAGRSATWHLERCRTRLICWMLFSLPHLVSNGSGLQKLTDFLSSPSYIIVQLPTQYLWNGMFDRHQVEITVMQFTGHSLPVHQSMSVAWDFTLSHIVSPACLRNFFP